MTELRTNAHRLAGALWRRSGEPETIKALARLLGYDDPEQLQTDMSQLLDYIEALETGG